MGQYLNCGRYLWILSAYTIFPNWQKIYTLPARLTASAAGGLLWDPTAVP